MNINNSLNLSDANYDAYTFAFANFQVTSSTLNVINEFFLGPVIYLYEFCSLLQIFFLDLKI